MIFNELSHLRRLQVQRLQVWRQLLVQSGLQVRLQDGHQGTVLQHKDPVKSLSKRILCQLSRNQALICSE